MMLMLDTLTQGMRSRTSSSVPHRMGGEHQGVRMGGRINGWMMQIHVQMVIHVDGIQRMWVQSGWSSRGIDCLHMDAGECGMQSKMGRVSKGQLLIDLTLSPLNPKFIQLS